MFSKLYGATVYTVLYCLSVKVVCEGGRGNESLGWGCNRLLIYPYFTQSLLSCSHFEQLIGDLVSKQYPSEAPVKRPTRYVL